MFVNKNLSPSLLCKPKWSIVVLVSESFLSIMLLLWVYSFLAH